MKKYLYYFSMIKRDLSLLNPHVIITPTIAQIDFSKLKQFGVKYLVFDKDNTLTSHLDNQFYNEQIRETIIQQCKKHFNEQSQIVLVSNGLSKLEEKAIDEIQKNLGLTLLKTQKKKPFNFNEIKLHFQRKEGEVSQNKTYINNHEIAFIGDRFLTDVFLANSNGAVSIYVTPFSTQNEEFGIKVMRFIEDIIIKKFTERRNHAFYLNQKVNLQDIIKPQSNQQK